MALVPLLLLLRLLALLLQPLFALLLLHLFALLLQPLHLLYASGNSPLHLHPPPVLLPGTQTQRGGDPTGETAKSAE